MKKNDEITVTIDDIGIHGEGIGKVKGFPFFVKNALPGDTVRAVITKMRPKYAYAKALEIITPSPDRISAGCPVAAQCGGCQLQELAYEKQLEFKQSTVREKLVRIGGFDADLIDRIIEPIRGMEEPWRFRNKAQYPVASKTVTAEDGSEQKRVAAGFYAGRTHHLIEQKDCLLEPEINAKILETVLAFVNERGIPAYDEEKGTGILRHIMIRHGFATKEILLCLVVRKYREKDWRGLIEVLAGAGLNIISIGFSVQPGKTNVIMGTDYIPVYGQPYIEDRIGDIRYRISPQSFYQVNPVQTKVLYDLAKECAGLTGRETLVDLYCGIGTIGLYLAAGAREVRGVEVIPEAVRDAQDNAKLNGIDNAAFTVGDAGDMFGEILEGRTGSDLVVIVDPPRKGCSGELLDAILSAAPDRIVYVSCDPATLARDMKILCEQDYKPERVIPVDQFCHSVHVECVVLMSEANT